MMTVKDMRAELARLSALPDDAPQGLPGAFYTDPDFFEWECQTVLRDAWHCLGRADEIANTGDFFTKNLLNEPLLVVRGADKIRVLSNVCRHRGMPVALGEGNAKRFVCTYHAWTYDHDGCLKRAARMKNASFDAKDYGLPEFACEIRNGFIYVNLAEDPSPLDIKPLEDLIASYEPETYHHLYTATEVWNCNWKCLVENFMEGYHLSVVHPQTLHEYTPTGLSRKGPDGPGFTSYFANYPETAGDRGKGSDKLTPEEQRRSSLFCVYPAQVASCAASLLVSLSLTPLTATSVEVRWTMSSFGDQLDDATLKQRVDLWNEVNREDREKLELMQSALLSRHATGGPLAGADYEGTVRDFQNWLAQQSARFS